MGGDCPLALPSGVAKHLDVRSWTPFHALTEELEGIGLQAVEKVPDDRILALRFSSGAILYLELRPIGPSLRLCDAAGLVRLALPASAGNGVHTYRPSLRSGRMEPDDPGLAGLADLPPGDLRRALVGRIRRMSPTLAEEALRRVAGGESLAEAVPGVLEEAFSDSVRFALWSRKPIRPEVFELHPSRDFRLSPFFRPDGEDWVRTEGSLSELASCWAGYVLNHAVFVSRLRNAQHDSSVVEREAAQKVHSLEQELASSDRGEASREEAELLLANLHRFGASFRGDQVEVEDYYSPEGGTRIILLQPDRDLKENAEALFRRYRKSRAARERLPGALEAARSMLKSARSRSAALHECVSPRELDSLVASLPRRRASRTSVTVRERGVGRQYQFRRFETSGGLDVLVGRGALENDRLTFRVGRPNDFWFHAADYPGAHVLLVWGRREDPSDSELIEAAALAAYFSDARREARVDVRCTRCKFVGKVKGTPGLVRLARFRTLRVVPASPRGGDE